MSCGKHPLRIYRYKYGETAKFVLLYKTNPADRESEISKFFPKIDSNNNNTLSSFGQEIGTVGKELRILLKSRHLTVHFLFLCSVCMYACRESVAVFKKFHSAKFRRASSSVYIKLFPFLKTVFVRSIEVKRKSRPTLRIEICIR
jgi:hypothetical protein